MAVLDCFGRKIEPGDLVMITSGKAHVFQVTNMEEPSNLIAAASGPAGRMTLSCAFDQPIVNPKRSPNVLFSDMVIVRKFTEIEVPEGTTEQ